MTDLDEYFRGIVPIIHYEIPESEREAVSIIQSWLFMLDGFVVDFYAALEIFDFANMRFKAGIDGLTLNKKSNIDGLPINKPPNLVIPPNIFSRWNFIAARSGAMTLREFQITMATIKGGAVLAPSLYEQVDIKKIRITEKLFNSRFPRTRVLRNQAGHVASSTIRQINSHRERGRGPLFLHNLVGRRYETTYEGEILSYELSVENLNKLNDVKLRIFECFDLVDILMPKTG